MDNREPKKSLRPPPRLRVKTGCNTCVRRRKKCTEERPICNTCARLKLQCTYRAPLPAASATPDDHSEASIPTPASTASSSLELLPLRPPLSVRHEGLRTERDWNVFNYSATRYMKLVTSPDALSKFRDLSFVFAVGFDRPWVVHAALAPAALHASFSSLISKEDAMLYTQSALRGLRQSLQPSRPYTLRRDSCLATSLFLGLFEECSCPHCLPSSHG